MSKVKIPYTMYCPACKVGIKVKNAKMIGTTIHCPKCKKRIDVVTPELDGHIPYGLGDAPPPPEERGPSPEEIREMEEAEERERRWRRKQNIKYGIELVFILGMLGFCGYVFYQKIYVEGYGAKAEQPKTFNKRVGS